MIQRSNGQRPGVTLLEVLTAIFIMAIGMLALLTLFPAGALSMARAVREDRAATFGSNAIALAKAINLGRDSNVSAELGTNQPVLVDPYYNILGSSTLAGISNFKRVAPSFIYDPVSSKPDPMLSRYFSFQDEIEFQPYGGVKGYSGNVNRPGTYTMAYLVRRPANATSEAMELSVLVFASRATDTTDGETAYTGSGTSGGTSITVAYSGAPPDIRSRSWLIDTSTGSGSQINAHCYRVESVTDTAGTSLQLNLDRPLRADVSSFVHFRDVIAIIEAGTIWVP